MDTPTPAAAAPKILFFFLVFVFIVGSTGVFMKHQESSVEVDHGFNSPRRQLVTTSPQVTNPVTVTVSPTPPLITVPSSAPVTVAPTPPSTVPPTTVPPPTPVTVAPTPPTTVPPPTPPTTLPPPSPTATTPVTNNPPPNNPVASPPPGQSWCVAKVGAAAASVQAALDYACGAGADCAAIQQGASCYNPNTLQNHASYAFSSFYQKHSGQNTSCDFKGAAEITNSNPSSGSCNYPTLSSSTSPTTAPPTTATPMTPMIPNSTTPTPMTPNPATPTPMTPNPATPTPMTPNQATPTPMTPYPMTPSSSSLAAPPTIFNRNSPPSGSGSTGFGENPPTSSTSSATMSASLQQPLISCIILVATIVKVLYM